MTNQQIIERDNAHVAHTYGRNQIALEQGRGLHVTDFDGKEYLDFTSGIGVNSLGYCDPDWVAAVSEQAGKLQHTSNLYYTDPCGQLAETLCKRTGFDKVFFANSGAEANEGSMKAARKYSCDTYGEGRYQVISLVNSFHGRTLASLTATGQEVFHHYFGPFNEGFAYTPANDYEAFLKTVTPATCAVIMEMVQGEGGVCALDKDYVSKVNAYCHEHDILIIVDEVQTGIGRTGTFLAYEQFDVQPDVVSLAKGLGGGLPIGAVLMSEKVAKGMGPGTHGTTFGGNPVVCAGANVVMNKLTDEMLADVRAKAVALRAGLAKLPHVQEVSGLGLMVGIAFEEGISAKEVLTACQDKGLLCLTAKTRLRLLPPLVLTNEDIEKALQILNEVLSAL